MARNVADAAQLLAIMAGQHVAAPGSLPGDPMRFAQPLAREWKGAKVGWLGNFDGYLPMEPEVLSVCEKALSGFEAAGFSVEAVQLDYPMERLWQTWLIYRHWQTRARGLEMVQDPDQRKHLKPEFIWEVEGGKDLTGDDLSRAMAARGDWHRALAAAYRTYDVLVWPSAQLFPFKADVHWPKQIAGKTMDTYHRWMETVIPGTLAGCPVINVPAGFSKAGLPMGLQAMTPRYEDVRALQIAYAYEQATQWHTLRRPPVST